jgi:hypothetical protein
MEEVKEQIRKNWRSIMAIHAFALAIPAIALFIFSGPEVTYILIVLFTALSVSMIIQLVLFFLKPSFFQNRWQHRD